MGLDQIAACARVKDTQASTCTYSCMIIFKSISCLIRIVMIYRFHNNRDTLLSFSLLPSLLCLLAMTGKQHQNDGRVKSAARMGDYNIGERDELG
uniref:Uncharacterized protein n=1 Tax=Arundo donax TaxID=35708 RepID=A0A0A9G9T6_ARUDO